MNDKSVQTPDRVSSYQQQAAMVRFLAEELGAGVRYVPLGNGATAIVTLPSGRIHRFNIYGHHEEG